MDDSLTSLAWKMGVRVACKNFGAQKGGRGQAIFFPSHYRAASVRPPLLRHAVFRTGAEIITLDSR